MDEDPDKRSEEEKEESKIKWQKSIHEVKNANAGLKSILEKIDRIRFKEVHDVYNKELNWFFAISVGTLLWILGNFDKFTIADGSMPYKIIYALSIGFVGFSSVWLTKLQAEFLRYQHKNTKNYNLLVNNTENIIKYVENTNQYIDNIIEKIDSQLFDPKSSNDVLNDLDKRQKHYEDIQTRLEKSLDSFIESNKKSVNVAFSENNIIPPLILYMVGVFCFSLYIMIFMRNYV